MITKIAIQYHRYMKIELDLISLGTTQRDINWDYDEELILDRETETMEYTRNIGSECKVVSIYRVQGGISSLLDTLDVTCLSKRKGNSDDTIEDPMEHSDYTITVYTKHGTKRRVKGTFDKNGLPNDWPEFIENIYNFMAFYGVGEIFDERIYGKIRRRKSDYIFCNVEFESGGRTYCYLADSDEYNEGDLVIVPAGLNNHEVVVKIESIEYHPLEEAPFPIEKIKHILRKYSEDEPVRHHSF